jgi:DNA repair exonuclease SbcCD ATPase subunit
MQQLIKRLELIKTCIILGDDELIPNQLAKLQPSNDVRVNAIITALNNAQFSHVVVLIEDFISRISGLVVYDDPQVAGLCLELKSLEQRLLTLTEEKQTTIQRIVEFRTQYHLALGELLQTILDVNYRIAYQKTLNKLKEQAFIEEAVKLAEANIDALKEKIKALKSSELNDEQIEELSEALAELKAKQAEFNETKAQLEDFEETLTHGLATLFRTRVS